MFVCWPIKPISTFLNHFWSSRIQDCKYGLKAWADQKFDPIWSDLYQIIYSWIFCSLLKTVKQPFCIDFNCDVDLIYMFSIDGKLWEDWILLNRGWKKKKSLIIIILCVIFYYFITRYPFLPFHCKTRNIGSSWTGGSDAANEGTWTWSDLTPFVYTKWRNKEPSNTGNEDCLVMRQRGQWNDQNCKGPNSFVCKITNVNGNLCFSANRKCSYKRSFLIILKIINMIKKFRSNYGTYQNLDTFE